MYPFWQPLNDLLDRSFPPGSSRRKVLQLISLVLLVEGLSVLALFSYVGVLLGLASLLVGATLMVLLFRRDQGTAEAAGESPGIRLVAFFERVIGGELAVMALGAVILLLVVLYNMFVSERPSYGDVDTISFLFGGLMLVHPVLSERWRIESTFALIFIGFVVLFLVVPQALMSMSGGGETSSIGNWYVHYMLAAPFAGILDTIGVPATSSGNLVTLQFQDGTVHALTISAYCAGLYSFSIFVSAFASFVLVFERLTFKMSTITLALGLLIAYLGNLLRMVFIGVVGYYRGLEALHWAHENIGWMIFLAWSAAFWWLILGYISRNSTPQNGKAEGD